MDNRVPPQNIEAEQSVLGALLIDKRAAGPVAERLRPEDFYRQAHQVIYSAMLLLYGKNEPIDMVTLVNELQKLQKLEDAGGVSYITLLANTVPTAANVSYHADIVEENSFRRQLIEGSASIAAMAYEGVEDMRSMKDKAEKTILLISRRKGASDFVHAGDLVADGVTHIEAILDGDEDFPGVTTGLTDLDNITAGMHPSDFIILAARPSMGKTALALNIAQNVAIRGAEPGREPKRVAFFSLEMSREQLIHRMLCAEGEVAPVQLHSNADPADHARLKEAIMDRLWGAAERLAASGLYIDDTPGLSILEMRSKARRLQAEGGLDLIVVDYLQLMQGSPSRNGYENRQQEVSEISRNLKALARELDVPVLALSQLSRNVEGRQVKKPMLSDLRESGSLEQDADIVMFLYRGDYYKDTDEEPDHITELIVAKHRNGPTGKVSLLFRDEYTKFVSLSNIKLPGETGQPDIFDEKD
ncbi:MAG: replicative DNA helicase [Acidaminococcaceae bacterium]|nr:replicative DNA helicase [Acidaminococcaceae bacterium]